MRSYALASACRHNVVDEEDVMKMLILTAALVSFSAMAAQGPRPAVSSGAITGRIVLDDGSPAAGVRVSAIDAGIGLGQRIALMSIVQTDEAGRYRLEGIPAGRYYVGAGRTDGMTYFPGAVTTSAATLITVEGGSITGIDFQMLIPPPVRVSGRVSLPSTPVANSPRGIMPLRVRLTGPRSLMTQAGPDGAFEFPDVPAGEYEVTIVPTDPTITPVRIVVAGKELRNVQLGLPTSPVSITVKVDEQGPIPRFQLNVTEIELASRPADADLRTTPYSAVPDLTVHLVAGSYRLGLSGLPRGYSVRSIATGSTDLLTNLLRVTPTQPIPVIVTLGVTSPPPWARVTGRVIGRDGKNTSATTVTLSGPALIAPISAPISASTVEGNFEFDKVPAGVYQARVSPSSGYFPITITVEPPGNVRVEIAPPSAKEIVGEFVKIQPGEFMMGCSVGDNQCLPEEQPLHKVRITKPFEIGRDEVTQLQWETVMGSNPSQFPSEDRPVENVNDYGMLERFLEKLNALNDGYRYRPPTEAEWEYAARAGSASAFEGPPEAMVWNINIQMQAGGLALAQLLGANGPLPSSLQGGQPASALASALTGMRTRPVGELRPNAWGLYDMQGNVWEWTSDWYDANYYKDTPEDDPKGPRTGQLRVLKGGSAVTPPDTVRVSIRGNRAWLNQTYIYGVRLVREPVAASR
jgi:formylglycine-generating enzyme required for sulfatase activity